MSELNKELLTYLLTKLTNVKYDETGIQTSQELGFDYTAIVKFQEKYLQKTVFHNSICQSFDEWDRQTNFAIL